MGGGAWIIDPEEGDVLALSDSTAPVVSAVVSLDRATRAKATYPRYVAE